MISVYREKRNSMYRKKEIRKRKLWIEHNLTTMGNNRSFLYIERRILYIEKKNSRQNITSRVVQIIYKCDKFRNNYERVNARRTKVKRNIEMYVRFKRKPVAFSPIKTIKRCHRWRCIPWAFPRALISIEWIIVPPASRQDRGQGNGEK